jgi:orotate phosphoribosyltransferase
MNPEEVRQALEEAGAILQDHFVLTSWRHSRTYVDKRRVYPATTIVRRLCEQMAHRAIEHGIHMKPKQPKILAVISPVIGGVALSQWIAYHLTHSDTHNWVPIQEVLALFAEKQDGMLVLPASHRKLITPDMPVLVADDILSTGSSVKEVVGIAREAGANVLGVSVIVNRGKVTAAQLGVPWLDALLELDLPSWEESECPLCRDNVPVNTEVGHGAEFLARKGGTGK